MDTPLLEPIFKTHTGEGGTHVMHGSYTLASLRCPRLTEHIGMSPTRQTLLAPSAKRREVLGESHMKGELHPTNRVC